MRLIGGFAAEVDGIALMPLLAREDMGLAVLPESRYVVMIKCKFPNALRAGLLSAAVPV